jgi:hypothetical protein
VPFLRLAQAPVTPSRASSSRTFHAPALRVRCGRALSPNRVHNAGLSSLDRVRPGSGRTGPASARQRQKEQVPAVLGLIHRVAVTESAALLVTEVQAEAQAGRIDPPVADPAQAPYSRLLRPGICDPARRTSWPLKITCAPDSDFRISYIICTAGTCRD